MNNIYKKLMSHIKKYFLNRISLRQSIYVAKRISFLLDAGVSLPDSLSLIAGQMKKKGKVFTEMAAQVARGLPITAVISQNNVFGKIALPIIKIGEESSMLAKAFSALSDELEKRLILKQKIIGAIMYPACITLGMFILVVVLITLVFPKIINVFASLNVALPLSTRLLIGLSNFLTHFGIFVLLILISLFIFLFYLFIKSTKFRFWFDKTILRVPLISNVVRTYILASVSNVIGLLMSNDLSLVESLTVAAETSSNKYFSAVIDTVIQDVKSGVSVSSSLKKFTTIFPSEYCDIVSIGEQTGRLSDTFVYAHILYSRDLDALTKSISSSVEPIMMVLVGLSIGFVAISVITPMYGITSHLHG